MLDRLIYSELAQSSGFAGYSGFVVDYWMLGGIVLGPIAGLVVGLRIDATLAKADDPNQLTIVAGGHGMNRIPIELQCKSPRNQMAACCVDPPEMRNTPMKTTAIDLVAVGMDQWMRWRQLVSRLRSGTSR